MSLVSKSFLDPILLMKVPAEMLDFSTLEKLQEKARQQPDFTFAAIGSVAICNSSGVTIQVQGEKINPGIVALFASSFTPTDCYLKGGDMRWIKIDSSLLLESNYGCILSISNIAIRQGINQIITVMPKEESYTKQLLAQFERYIEEFEDSHDQDLFQQRKAHNPEFSKYCDDPAKYVEELKGKDIFAAEISIRV